MGIPKNWTLEVLETSDAPAARIWRFVRDHPESTRSDITVMYGKDPQHSLAALVRRGWIEKCPHTRRVRHMNVTLYRARTDGIARVAHGKAVKAQALERELGRLARRCAEGRQNGLAVTMGQVLMEVEKELRELQEKMYRLPSR